MTTPKVSWSSATIDLAVTIDNDSKNSATVTVATQFYQLDSEGRKIGDSVAQVQPAEVAVAASSSAVVKGSATIINPKLWGPVHSNDPTAMAVELEVVSKLP